MADTSASVSAEGIVMIKSEPLPEGTPEVRGYDFNKVLPPPFISTKKVHFLFLLLHSQLLITGIRL